MTLFLFFANFSQTDEAISLPEVAALLLVGCGLIAAAATLRRWLQIKPLTEQHLSQSGKAVSLHETR